MRGAKRRIVEGKVAGNKEARHERLLRVSRLDGRKRGNGGREGWIGDTKRKKRIFKKEGEVGG